MTEDKFYTSPIANTIIAELTNHFQRTRFITPATDKHYSLASEDYFCLCYQNISHQQQIFFWTTAWGFSANLPLRMWCKSTWKVTRRISYIWWNWKGERLSKWLDQYIINNPYACWHTLILLSLPTLTLKIQIPVSVLRKIPKIIIKVKNIPTWKQHKVARRLRKFHSQKRPNGGFWACEDAFIRLVIVMYMRLLNGKAFVTCSWDWFILFC